jgi:uncharacterized protein
MFAVKPFKRRAYIATYRGPLLTEAESKRIEARNNRYLFTLNSKWTIDGSPRYNVARYINHSCRPNAEPVTRNGSIKIIATRRIEPGEEITYDYGADYKYFFFSKGRCRCQHCQDKKARKRRRARKARRKLDAKNSRTVRSPVKLKTLLKAKTSRRASSVRRVNASRKASTALKRKAA